MTSCRTRLIPSSKHQRFRHYEYTKREMLKRLQRLLPEGLLADAALVHPHGLFECPAGPLARKGLAGTRRTGRVPPPAAQARAEQCRGTAAGPTSTPTISSCSSKRSSTSSRRSEGPSQSNGFIEHFHRTLLEKHLRIKGRTTCYESVEERQKDLDGYLEADNTRRLAPRPRDEGQDALRGLHGRDPKEAAHLETLSENGGQNCSVALTSARRRVR